MDFNIFCEHQRTTLTVNFNKPMLLILNQFMLDSSATILPLKKFLNQKNHHIQILEKNKQYIAQLFLNCFLRESLLDRHNRSRWSTASKKLEIDDFTGY